MKAGVDFELRPDEKILFQFCEEEVIELKCKLIKHLRVVHNRPDVNVDDLGGFDICLQ